MTDIEERFPPSPLWSSVGAKHDWPRNTLQDDVEYVTHGRFENLPQSTSKVVRIFMSSTFTDFYVERNLLMKNVYPKLQKLCKEKYDLEFQVVDMRWGIRSEASVDHSASELCMKEIEMCKRFSVGPTFVTLLSHRYGGRTLPTKISHDEMDIIRNIVKANSEDDVQMIEKWYKLDTNAHAPEYILQPIVDPKEMETFLQDTDEKLESLNEASMVLTENEIEGKIKDENKQNAYNELVSSGKAIWMNEEPLLKNIIRGAVKKAIQEGIMSEKCGLKYVQSITEEEIREGIVNETNSDDRCLAFVRDIEDVNLKHNKAWRFVEMDGEEINLETTKLMENVRNEVIPKALPAANIHYFKTRWSDDQGINEHEHAEYLSSFCETFEKSILSLIEKGVSKQSVESVGEVYADVLEHSHQCVQKVRTFHGREDILNTVKSYILSACEQPLVIYGESGCGKTSILAKAAINIPNWLCDNESLLVILRFLGTTPYSSTVDKLLLNISNQLISLLALQDRFPDLPQEFSDLKDVFKDILSVVPSNKRVVIFLDSLDQLAGTNNAHKLLWLPCKLPTNVKLVVSTLPEENNILGNLASQNMNLEKSQFIPVQDMATNTSHEIMDIWLEKWGRTLSHVQKEIIDVLLRDNVRPLYLKLIFDEISNWKSYEEPVFNCPTIQACLQRLYRKLETKHGVIIVTKALGYLSASKNGLTPIEIEDILSLDDEVLSDVFEYHIPPVRRLPSILWARIRSDMTEYIVDRDADGAKVMAWYHRQFIQEAIKRYLPETSAYGGSSSHFKKNMSLYKGIADYFSGIWGNDKQKPFQYTVKQAEKLGLGSVDAKENRYVPSQPVVFRSEMGAINLENIRYNRRKLSELPAALLAVHYHKDITSFIAKHIVLNQEFLAAWIKNELWGEIIDFLSEVGTESPYAGNLMESIHNKISKDKTMESEDDESNDWDSLASETSGLVLQMSTLQQCLLLSYTNVLNNPTYLGPDISGRMLQYNHGIMDGISKWIKYTDTEGRKMCALIPPHMQLETTGTELMLVMNNHIGPIYDAKWASHDSNNCLSVSKKFVSVSLDAGQILIDTRPRSMPKDDSFQIIASISNDYNPKYYASLKQNPWVYIFDVEGEVIDIIDFTKEGYQTFSIDKMFVTHTGDEQVLYVIDTSKSFCIMVFNAFRKERKFVAIPLHEESKILNMLVESSPDRLLIYDDKGCFKLCHYDGSTIDERSFKWPSIKVNDAVLDKHNGHHKMIFGFENGQISILTFESENENLQQLKVFNLFSKNQLKLKPIAKYGVPDFIHHYSSYDQYNDTLIHYPLGLACTETHLLFFGNNEFMNKSVDPSENKINTDEGDVAMLRNNKNQTVKEDMSPRLQMFCRIERRYNRAVITSYMQFILAAREGGILDIFKIADPSAVGDKVKHKFPIRFFTTIDCHGQDITNILPTGSDMLFMTTSADASLKGYLLARAGAMRKYIPNFDRADQSITEIMPGDNFALTFSGHSRLIHQWEITQGRIRKIFEHPQNDFFVKCATDENMEKVVALDYNGRAFIWSINDEKSTSDLAKSTVDRTNSVEVPDADKVINDSITFLSNTKSQDVHMLVFNQGTTFIASKKGIDVKILNPYNAEKVENISDLKGGFEYCLKLKRERVLLVNEGKFSVYNMLTRKCDVRDRSLVNDGEILDIKYVSKTDSVVCITNRKVIIWNSESEETSQVQMGNVMEDVKLMSTSEALCLAINPQQNEYVVFDSFTGDVRQNHVVMSATSQKWQNYCCTPDGKYLIYVFGDKQVHLIRLSDGRLLAWYTMYDKVQSLTTSRNSWYVLIGTSDRRLFVLLIADPDEREHDNRISYAREKNPPLTLEQGMELMAGANAFGLESDEEYGELDGKTDDDMIARTEKRLNKRADNALGKNIRIIFTSDTSDDDGDADDDEVDVTNAMFSTRSKAKNVPLKQDEIIDEESEAYEGDLYSSSPCSLQ